MLCDTCLNIDIDELQVDIWTNHYRDPEVHSKGYKHYANFSDLTESATKRQCELCQLILDQFHGESDHITGRESFFEEQIYCGIANERYNDPGENQGSSKLWVYWNIDGLDGQIIRFANFGICIERSLLGDLPHAYE